MRNLLYPASFDPITNGHVWMIERGSEMADYLTIAIAQHPTKQYTFSIEDRMLMMCELLAARNVENVTVVNSRDMLTAHLAAASNSYILRGLRGVSDVDYERSMRHVNHDIAAVQTIFLMPPSELERVSSSMVRGICQSPGGLDDIQSYVPPNIFKWLKGKYGNT